MALAVAIVAGVGAYLGMADRSSAARVVVGVKVPADQRVSFDQIDHTSWHELLQTYVDEAGRVDYHAWHRSPESMARLDAYLARLSSGDLGLHDLGIQSTREGRLAYWINAYNAVTVKGILREYPTKSIRDHTPLLGYNIWKHLLLQVADQQISLNDIEHEVLRKMNEPRIHFAIVCASISCPRLLNEAYVAENLDEQLTRNAKQFFTLSRNFAIDGSNHRVHLSSILKWFAKDFGSHQAAQLQAISPYLPNDKSRQAVAATGVRVEYLPYDWGLNERPPE